MGYASIVPCWSRREIVARPEFEIAEWKYVLNLGDVLMAEMKDMWRCPTSNCGYVYDPDRGDKRHGIPKGTKFEDLPDDWVCPVCGASKKNFKRLSETS